MRTLSGVVLTCGVLSVATIALAQPPGAKPDGDLVTRMMGFDADKSGTLTKAEITDERLIRLFGRADTDKDGVVTKAELAALEAKEESKDEDGPPGFGPPGFGPPGFGPPGFGPPGGGPPRGPGGPGGFMGGMPRPGEVLPSMLQQVLKLDADQKAKLADLQKEVDAKLDSILNDEQKQRLKQMRDRGPGGFGPPPGGGRRRGGPGGPGGGPGGPGGGPPPPDRP